MPTSLNIIQPFGGEKMLLRKLVILSLIGTLDGVMMVILSKAIVTLVIGPYFILQYSRKIGVVFVKSTPTWLR